MATGIISKSFRNYLRRYLSNIPEKHEIKEIEKVAILALGAYFEKYLCESTQRLSGETALHVAHTAATEELQHYIP